MASRPLQQTHSSQAASQARSSADSQDRQDLQEDSLIEARTIELDQENPSDHSSTSPEMAQQSRAGAVPSPPLIRRIPTNDRRLCWICFADETEDTPNSSPWRTPCSCALTAHESCLLDWVADLEAPTRQRSNKTPKVQCPQCKSEIRIERPRNALVRAYRALEHVAYRLTMPFLALVLAGGIWTSALVHGLGSFLLVFGPHDFQHMFFDQNPRDISTRWILGLPLVPWTLLLARTRLIDNALPILPLLFLAGKQRRGAGGTSDLWPPTAAVTFAMLPYVRAAYLGLYRQLFAERAKKWQARVQPRAGTTDDDGNAGANGNEQNADGADAVRRPNADGDVIFELNLGVEIGHEHQRVDNPPEPGEIVVDVPAADILAADDIDDGEIDAHGNGVEAIDAPDEEHVPALAAAHARRENHGDHDNNANAGENNVANDGNNNNNGNHQTNLILSLSRLADTVAGALAFPLIAALSGRALQLVLPRSWTTFPSSSNGRATILSSWAGAADNNSRSTGFGAIRPHLLQTQWGRSVVGGCLFILGKDAWALYALYRTAHDHDRRKVLNWPGKRPGRKSRQT